MKISSIKTIIENLGMFIFSLKVKPFLKVKVLFYLNPFLAKQSNFNMLEK
jgi:hypothetical protein